MESNFSNREFEQYIKSTADQYRMIPNEKVWKGINNTLHTRRKWYGIGLASLLLLTAISVTWVMLSYPASKKHEIASEQNLPDIAKIQPSSTPTMVAVPKDIGTILSFNKFSTSKPEVSVPANDGLNELSASIETSPTSLQVSDFKLNEPTAEAKNHDIVASQPKLQININPTTGILSGEPKSLNILGQDDKTIARRPVFAESQPARISAVYYPLTIESVLNSYQAKKIIKRLSWQVYFAPTVSYRKLSVNKSYDGSVSPFSANNYPFANSRDVNSEVTHKPDMGLELGLSTKYPLSKNLKLTGAFQFNINRYDIKAFAYYGEEATINLNGGNGTNSVRAWTYYRNYDGYKSDWLKNYYFSVSAPVGAELKIFGNERTYFGIAGNVQPTYIIKDRAFLISTDYKNYVEVPRLIRHWNINTSLETFISYTSHSNRTRWQIGPQVRYQVLSSFKNKYPVNENLFDFGLKVGVSRNK